jgi:hypothetical protein
MKLKWNLMAVLLTAILLVAMAPLAAQQSNTYKATSGLFSSDVDNYLSVTNFGKVSIDKWFAFTNLQGSTLDLGYARKIGSLYFGTYYNGTIVLENDSAKENSATTPTVINGVVSTTSTVTTKSWVTDNGSRTDNNGSIFLGIAGMGFKLGFDEDITTYKTPNGALSSQLDYSTITSDSATNSVTSKVYSDMSKVSGYMTPSLAWGTNIALGSLTLSPKVVANFKIQQDSSGYTYNESTTMAGTTVLGSTTKDATYTSNEDYFNPDVVLNVNLSGAKVEGTQLSGNIEYEFSTNIYGTEGDTSTTVTNTSTETVSGLTTTEETSKTATLRNNMTNAITPTFKFTKDLSDRVSVGCNVKARVSYNTYGSTKTDTWDKTTTTDSYTQDPADNSTKVESSTTPDGTYANTILMVAPALNLAFTYQVVPAKFSVKSGLAVTAPKYTNTVKKYNRSDVSSSSSTTTDGNNVVTNSAYTNNLSSTRNESVTVENTWGSLSTQLYFGATFNFSEKFALDMYTSFGNTGTASLFGTTGGNSPLTNSMSLSFIVKN